MSTLSKVEVRALKAAHQAMVGVLPLENELNELSYTRVAAALFGQCKGIEAGAFGAPSQERHTELGAILNQYLDEGFLRSAEPAGAA